MFAKKGRRDFERREQGKEVKVERKCKKGVGWDDIKLKEKIIEMIEEKRRIGNTKGRKEEEKKGK